MSPRQFTGQVERKMRTLGCPGSSGPRAQGRLDSSRREARVGVASTWRSWEAEGERWRRLVALVEAPSRLGSTVPPHHVPLSLLRTAPPHPGQ